VFPFDSGDTTIGLDTSDALSAAPPSDDRHVTV
jgi:hypothetical protein